MTRQINERAREQLRRAGRKGGLANSQSTEIMRTNPDMIISRKDAVALGFTVYRTGKPCKNGHFSWRRTYNPVCVQCKSEGLV